MGAHDAPLPRVLTFLAYGVVVAFMALIMSKRMAPLTALLMLAVGVATAVIPMVGRAAGG